MAKTIAQTSSTSSSDNAARDQLVAILLSNTQKTEGSPIRETIADVAASSLNTAAVIAGAFTGAYGNAKQSFKLEANFRAAEREVGAVKMAQRYADRLLALQKS